MKEALKLGLEALCVAVEPKKGKVYAREFEPIDCFAMHEQAITAIKEALAQPEQEPVAWHTEDHLTDRSATTYSKDMVYRWECKGWPVTPLYTTPPQRTWVGLTKNEVETLSYQTEGNTWKAVELAEAKLKEKNV